MATLQDLKNSIAAKDAEMKAKIAGLEAQIAQATGGPTAAELDEIKAGIDGIGVTAPAAAPVVGAPVPPAA